MNAIRKDIYKHILTKISEAELGKGDRIPTEMQLAGEFNTNRMNAHLAIKKLESEGIVKRNKRQGTIVIKGADEFDAESLKTMASNLVYVMASPPGMRFNIHWNEGTLLDFETTLSQDGYKVILHDFPDKPEMLRNLMDDISKTDSKALVMLPDHGTTQFVLDNLDPFDAYRGDIVMLDRGGMPLDAFPYHTIGFNSFEEGKTAGMYLKNKDFQNIFFFGFSAMGALSHWVQQRYEGLKFALKDYSSVQFYLAKGREDSARDAVSFLKSTSKEKPVLVAANDELASCIINEASKNGLFCPGDFFLMGFNNVIDYRSYNLTSVASAIDKIGIALASMVSKQLPLSQAGTQMKISLKSRVIERETC